MTEENIAVMGLIVTFIFVGAFAGSMVTGCLMANSYTEDLCIKLYSNTQDYKACLDRPWREVIEEVTRDEKS